jgi:hypothetical protein
MLEAQPRFSVMREKQMNRFAMHDMRSEIARVGGIAIAPAIWKQWTTPPASP